MFWLIDRCDRWDKLLFHESVAIDGQCATLIGGGPYSIFGIKAVAKVYWNGISNLKQK